MPPDSTFFFGALLAALSLAAVAANAQQTSAPRPAERTATESTTACTYNDSAPRSGDSVTTLTSTEPGQTPLDQSFECLSHEEWVAETRRQAFSDTNFYGQLRSFYLDSNNLNGSENQAWALGGSAGFKTGYFRDFFAFGATAYSSQRLYGPEDKDGTLLLLPGQHGYSVLGEAYAQFLLTEAVTANVGLKSIDTPYVGRQDIRMTPNTFEAAFVQGEFGGSDGTPRWRFGAGYVDKIKQRNSDEFVSMATAAGAPPGVSRGVSLAGANYTVGDLSIGGIDYYSSDIINIAYTEVKDAFAVTDRLRLQLAAQYSNQQSVGDDLLTGHKFYAEQYGVKGELTFGGSLLTAGYTATGHGTNIQSPWNLAPGYTVGLVGTFNRAGENAWMLRAAHNFQVVEGLSAWVLCLRGTQPDAPNQYKQDEYDFNLQWKATSGRLEGLRLVALYAHVSQAGPTELHTDQLRLIVYYTPPWF
jgi:hypothetical protein